jgi:hypothetical protein
MVTYKRDNCPTILKMCVPLRPPQSSVCKDISAPEAIQIEVLSQAVK